MRVLQNACGIRCISEADLLFPGCKAIRRFTIAMLQKDGEAEAFRYTRTVSSPKLHVRFNKSYPWTTKLTLTNPFFPELLPPLHISSRRDITSTPSPEIDNQKEKENV
jgi:hypothetical protein